MAKQTLKELALLRAPARLARKERSLCETCARFKGCHDSFVFPDQQGWNGNLLCLVSQWPDEGVLEFIERVGVQAGFTSADMLVYPVLRCGAGRKPTIKQIRSCRPFLMDLVKSVKPKAILAFGPIAAQSATNDGAIKTITEHRGFPYEFAGTEIKVYVTYEPAAIIEGAFSLKERVLEDLRRCKQGGLSVLAPPGDGVPEGDCVGVDAEFMPDGTPITLASSTSVSGAVSDVSSRSGTLRVLESISRASILRGHNLAVDIDVLARLRHLKALPNLNTWIRGIDIADSLTLSRMTDENRGKGAYKLEVLLRSSYHAPTWKDTDEPIDVTLPNTWPIDYRLERCRMDAWAASILCEVYQVGAQGPVEFTNRITQTLRRIYHAGAAVDMKYFEGLGQKFSKEAAQAKIKLLTVAGRAGIADFSPTNDGHIRKLLFEYYKFPVEAKTKGGLPSVNKTFLNKHKDHEAVRPLLEFNKYDKRNSTYIEGIRDKIVQVGGKPYLRFRINPLGARTGRRSSDKPNAQNWSKDVRSMIVSRFPGGMIADNDYSKLEVILFAFVAKEWKLLEFFQKGNGYIAVGKELFNKEVKEGTYEYTSVKSLVLGIQFGMGAFKLACQLWEVVGVKLSEDWDTHVKLAEELRRRYLSKFPGIKRYMWNQKQTLLKLQEVSSLTGRVRHLPCPYGEETPGFGHLLNQAINFPIQSLASDVTGSAMLDVEERLLQEYNLTYTDYHCMLMEGQYKEMPLLINEVHDDLVFDMPVKRQKDMLFLITETMKEVPTLRKLCPQFTVALNVGQKVSERWCGE